MRTPEVVKVYFWHLRAEGECKPSEEDLQGAIDDQGKPGYVCGVFDEVPGTHSYIRDYDAITTTKQFFSTKVHAVFEGGHTLDCWADVNDDHDKCWFGWSDYGDLNDMLTDYACENLPEIEDD